MVIQIYDCTQEIVFDTFDSIGCSYAKNDAASDTYQLFDGQSNKFPNQRRNWYFILFRDIVVCKNQCWKYQIYLFKIWSYKFLFLCRNWYKILLALTHVCNPEMMLPVIQTSCLKDSHTNLEKYVGIGPRYFGDSLSLYVKK